jgi:hypothetical protein
MSSVADDLRARTRARVMEMPIRERIQLALTLGERDIEIFVRSTGVDRHEALRRLRARRRRGRIPSACADGGR